MMVGCGSQGRLWYKRLVVVRHGWLWYVMVRCFMFIVCCSTSWYIMVYLKQRTKKTNLSLVFI